jgi:hypothetical protein
MIRMQMSGASQQPIIIQTGPVVAQQTTQNTVTSQPQNVQQPQIIQLQQVCRHYTRDVLLPAYWNGLVFFICLGQQLL